MQIVFFMFYRKGPETFLLTTHICYFLFNTLFFFRLVITKRKAAETKEWQKHEQNEVHVQREPLKIG